MKQPAIALFLVNSLMTLWSAADAVLADNAAAAACTEIVQAEKRNGEHFDLVVREGDEGGLAAQLLSEDADFKTEIVALDRRIWIEENNPMFSIADAEIWSALTTLSAFHVTLRWADGRTATAKYEALDVDAWKKRLQINCSEPVPDVDPIVQEDRLALSAWERKFVNWALAVGDGNFVDPAQARDDIGPVERERILAASRRAGIGETRHLNAYLVRLALRDAGFDWMPRFDAIGNVDTGIAAVRQGESWGLIGGDGSWVRPPVFEDVRSSDGGYTPVRSSGFWGVVDDNGDFVHAPKFADIQSCSEKKCAFRSSDRWGFLNLSGGVQIRPSYISVDDFSEGHAAVRSMQGWALIDQAGSVKARVNAETLSSPSDGLSAFTDTSGKIGFIDLTGKVAVQPIFQKAYPFSEGLAAVSRKGKWGYVDRQGTLVIPLGFSNAGRFSDGLAPVRATSGLWGYIDTDGAWQIRPKYPRAFEFREGAAIVRWPNPLKPNSRQPADLRRGYIDRKGNWIIQPAFEDAYVFRNGFAPVKILGRWGVIRRPESARE